MRDFMFIMLYRSILKDHSFSRVLLSAFLFLFQNKVFKGLFRKYRHNVQIISHYVRSDLGISHLQMLSAYDTSMQRVNTTHRLWFRMTG